MGIGLSAVVAAAVLTGGCGLDQRPAGTVKRPTPSTVKHWGSFFGGQPGNFNTPHSLVVDSNGTGRRDRAR